MKQNIDISKNGWLSLEEFYKKYPQRNPKAQQYKNLDDYTIEEIRKELNKTLC